MHCDCSRQCSGWQGRMWGYLAGGPLLVKEEEGKRGGLVLGVEVQHCVETPAYGCGVKTPVSSASPSTCHSIAARRSALVASAGAETENTLRVDGIERMGQ